MSGWPRRPRIGWLTAPVSGACFNPSCAPAITTVVGWTLADGQDPRSRGFWCETCFQSLVELALAVGLPIETAVLPEQNEAVA